MRVGSIGVRHFWGNNLYQPHGDGEFTVLLGKKRVKNRFGQQEKQVHNMNGLKNRWGQSATVGLSKIIGGTITYTDCGYALDNYSITRDTILVRK